MPSPKELTDYVPVLSKRSAILVTIDIASREGSTAQSAVEDQSMICSLLSDLYSLVSSANKENNLRRGVDQFINKRVQSIKAHI